MNPEDDLITAAYAELARPTAPAAEPLAAVRQRMRHRVRRRRGAAVAATAVVVAAVGLGVGLGTASAPTDRGSAGAAGGAATSPTPSGPLPAGQAQSCAVSYDRPTLRRVAWAADATVSRIGRGRGTVPVELDVHTWYRGGTGSTLEVRLPSPRTGVEDAPPAYAVGTRLLLSGARSGAELLPWTCGFTRYYSPRTAAVWAEVLR